MKYVVSLLIWFLVFQITSFAQSFRPDRKILFWEQKTINIGAILEENGPVTVEFFGLNQNATPILLTDIVTDCGCTTVDYSRDTLNTHDIAAIKVRFDPEQRGGNFRKMIIVRSNTDNFGDTLFLEGINMPLPENNEVAFPYRIGNLGFRLSGINLGTVFNNEPKVKYVEVFNFGKENTAISKLGQEIPPHLEIALEPEVLQPGTRGVLVIRYDGKAKNDLGFIEEILSLKFWESAQPVEIKLQAVVYEYFPPVPKSMEHKVAKLGISDVDIDLREISSGQKVSRNITLTNLGPEPLEIRKLITSCSCLQAQLEQTNLLPGERADLRFTFDPKGRRGIDHKHITLFSNDPLNPVRTITIKSSIK
jgi:hypothetical protein